MGRIDRRGWAVAGVVTLAMVGTAALMPTRWLAALAAMLVGAGIWTGLARRHRYAYWRWLPVILLTGLMLGADSTLVRNALLAGEVMPLRVEDLASGTRVPALPRRVRMTGFAPEAAAYRVLVSYTSFDGTGKTARPSGRVTNRLPWQGLVPPGWHQGDAVPVVINRGFATWRQGRLQAVTGILYADPYRPGDWPIPDNHLARGLQQAPFPLPREAYVLDVQGDWPHLWERLGSTAAANALLVVIWLWLYGALRKTVSGPVT